MVDVRFASAFLVPLLATLLMTPMAGRLAVRLGIVDQPSHHKFHREARPYLGGLALAAGVLVGAVLAPGWAGRVLAILAIGLTIGLTGLIDDWRALDRPTRVLVEAAGAIGLWVAGVRAELFNMPLPDLAITVLWVVGITNALNLLDNMDGLAAGAGAIAAATLSAIALMRGDPGTAWLALGLAGACVGFLRYNFPPAKVFLGDAGSLFIGFVLAALTLRLALIGDGNLGHSAIPLLILGAPVFDMMLVVLARAREGRPVYVGGRDHGSHRLASMGLSDRAVAVAFYGAQAAFCGSALGATQASAEVAAALILALGLVSVVALGVLLSVKVQGPGSERAVVGSKVPVVQST